MNMKSRINLQIWKACRITQAELADLEMVQLHPIILNENEKGICKDLNWMLKKILIQWKHIYLWLNYNCQPFSNCLPWRGIDIYNESSWSISQPFSLCLLLGYGHIIVVSQSANQSWLFRQSVMSANQKSFRIVILDNSRGNNYHKILKTSNIFSITNSKTLVKDQKWDSRKLDLSFRAVILLWLSSPKLSINPTR